MDIDYVFGVWIKRRHALDMAEIDRLCGVRKSGIEYRIMLEAGVATREPYVDVDELIGAIEVVWQNLRRIYPRHMDALNLYYMRKRSYRAVRMLSGISQYESKKLVEQAKYMIIGGIYSLPK